MFIESIIAEKGGEVVTVTSSATIGETIAALAARNIGAILVVEAGTVVGIVSERDIVKHLAGSADGFRAQPVSAIMTRSPRTCALTDTIEHAINLMSRGRFRHLPVIEDGALVGIISMGDVVKRKLDQVEQEAEELRDYIAS